MKNSQKPDFFGLSDIGRARKNNEDQFLIAELSKSMLLEQTTLPIEDSTRLSAGRRGKLLVVADGMGGQPAGERASAVAVQSIIKYALNVLPWFFRLKDDEGDLEGDLKRAMEKCQASIERDAAQNPERQGMGSTLTMAYILWPALYAVHVGDSRAYLFRRGHLEQITQDHTIGQQLVAQGIPQGGPSGKPPFRKVLWNFLGGSTPDLSPAVYKVQIQEDDTLLLATDGLGRHVSDSEIADVLAAAVSTEESCHRLIDLANERGGRDNTTVIIARYPRTEAAKGETDSAVDALKDSPWKAFL
jgi:serine/threonine protein phosphatase PrpC